MKTIIEFFEPPIMRLCLLIGASMLWIAGYNLVPWLSVDGTTWAAWVQAVGSIAAILGAFEIANKQTRLQNQQVKERELEATVRSAAFTSLAAKRVVAAVEHAIRLLEEHAEKKEKQFNYDARFLSIAENLILMALAKDLSPEQAKLLVSLHSDLVNFMQGIADIKGYYDPLGYDSVRTKAFDLRGQLMLWSFDADFAEDHARHALNEVRFHA